MLALRSQLAAGFSYPMELVNAFLALVLLGVAWVLTVELLKLPTRRRSAAAVSSTDDAVDVAKRFG